MNRYLLTFYKKDNMRFISHLDLQRLFQRAIKRGNVKVAYSNGFNPHELMNIVQPLSLGFESEGELVEIDTEIPYEPKKLMSALNLALPEGIKFIDCIETERKNKDTTCPTKYAEYSLTFEDTSILSKLRIDEFLKQDQIIIQKHDKKTKKFVDKDVKDMVIKLYLDGSKLIMLVSCGSNKTLNPSNLISSLLSYSGIDCAAEYIRITRTKLVKDE